MRTFDAFVEKYDVVLQEAEIYIPSEEEAKRFNLDPKITYWTCDLSCQDRTIQFRYQSKENTPPSLNEVLEWIQTAFIVVDCKQEPLASILNKFSDFIGGNKVFEEFLYETTDDLDLLEDQ